MPQILRVEEETTLYPIRSMQHSHYDPYHDYYVIRKERNTFRGRNVGMLKRADNGEMYIAWLDDNSMSKVEHDWSPVECVLHKLVTDFEIIEFDPDKDGCFVGHSRNFDKCAEIRKEIIERLLDEF